MRDVYVLLLAAVPVAVTGLAAWMRQRMLASRRAYGRGIRLESSLYEPENLPRQSSAHLRPGKRPLYVSLPLTVEPPSPAQPELRASDLLDDLRASGKVYVVLGAAGSGKSALLRHLSFELSFEGIGLFLSDKSAPTPVLLNLRYHTDRILRDEGVDIAELAALSEAGDAVGLSWFRSTLTRRCAVLLDGLDEVPDPAERAQVVGWLREQFRRYPRASWVITSRPAGYPEDALPATRVLRIGGFDRARRDEFLRRWHEEMVESDPRNPPAITTDDLVASVERSPALRELSTSPALLTLIARVHFYRGVDPRNVAEVCDQAIVQFVQWRPEAKGITDHGGLTGSQRLRVARQLAMSLVERKDRRFGKADVYALADRVIRGPGDAQSFLVFMRDSGLLTEPEPGTYEFAHRTLQEYLAAEQIRVQGSVRMLIARIEDPSWEQVIRFWAAQSDASPVIEACLDLGGSRALALARMCLEVTPQVAPELREAVQGIGPWAGDQWRGLGVGALVDYLEELKAVTAARLIERTNLDELRLSPEDFAEFTATLAADEDPADPDVLLSAAVLGDEVGHARDAARFRARGLIALALDVRGQSRESARDLCLAAVAALRAPSAGDAVLRRAVLTYLDATPDADLTEALRRHQRGGESVALHLVVPMLAHSEAAGNLLVDAVRADDELSRRATADLRAGWSADAEAWRRERRALGYRLRSLAEVELDGEALREAAERIADQRDAAPASMELEALADALQALQTALADQRFDHKDRALRKAVRTAQWVRTSIGAAPTTLAVQVVEPAAARIEALADQARRDLADEHPPQPRLTPALPSARVHGTVATLQLRVDNADGAAPVESAWLAVSADPARYVPVRERIDLPAPVAGGTSATVLVPLQLCEEAADVAEAEVVLHHRLRHGEAVARKAERFALPVERGYRPVRRNPFAKGADGIPIEDPAMFFGRDELIERIRRRLSAADEPGAGIAIYGQKRTGKSSIALQLMKRLAAEDGFGVVDAGSLGGLSPARVPDADRRLLAALLWRILTKAKKTVQGDPPLIPSGFTSRDLAESLDPVEHCAELLRDCRAAHPGLPPWVVFIDEFQHLDRWIRDELVPSSFMQSVKAIMEARLFHLVLVGQPRLKGVIEADANAFGVFGVERVTYLDDAGARALIREPVAAATGEPGRLLEPAVGRIIELTGGNPYYLQKFCYELVEYMNAERAGTVTEADVAEVAGRLVETVDAGVFDNLESPGGIVADPDAGAVRKALTSVAQAAREGRATRHEIEHCHDGDLPAGLLDDLASAEVLRRDAGGYRIAVGLYRSWLLRYFVRAEGDS